MTRSASIVHYVIYKSFNRNWKPNSQYFTLKLKFANISYVYLTVVWKPVDLFIKGKKKDMKDLTELMPVSAANYYNYLLANLEKIQTDKQNDKSSIEDDLMDYTT